MDYKGRVKLMEVIITLGIAAAAAVMLFKNFSRKSKGNCCGGCSTKKVKPNS
jgi:hypothetical protein